VIRRIATLLFAGSALVAVACIDMSAPKGAASISTLLLPSPSVVVGDSMRDSLGVVAPLRVIAYDADNTPITNLPAQFFVTDSAPAGHIDSGALLLGDKQGTLHVIGQISGVQTTPVDVPVTVAPKTLALGPIIDTLRVSLVRIGDTTVATADVVHIPVTLKGIGDTAVIKFVVKYELKSAPATIAGSTVPAVSLVDDGNRASVVDTTDGSGASRTLLVRAGLLANDSLPAGKKTDSAVVIVTTSYRGKPVAGSPLRVAVPLKAKVVIP
jgi:hypothetical protein